MDAIDNYLRAKIELEELDRKRLELSKQLDGDLRQSAIDALIADDRTKQGGRFIYRYTDRLYFEIFLNSLSEARDTAYMSVDPVLTIYSEAVKNV